MSLSYMSLKQLLKNLKENILKRYNIILSITVMPSCKRINGHVNKWLRTLFKEYIKKMILLKHLL